MTSEKLNKHRNSILMMCHYPDLDSTSDWLEICFSQMNKKHHQDLGSDVSSVWRCLLSLKKCQLFSRANFLSSEIRKVPLKKH